MRHLIGLGSSLIYFAFSLLGRKRRFACAVGFSRLVEPLLKRRKPPFSLDSDREHSLSFLLGGLTLRGIEFDPQISVRGAELLEPPRGMLLLSGHFYLNLLFCRWLYDRGRAPTSVMTTELEQLTFSGTKAPFEVLPPRNLTLRQIKRCVDAGKLVVVAIDNHFPYENWRRVKTAHKEIYISENIVRFAVKAQIPIAFFATRIEPGDRILTEIEAPSKQTAAIVFEEFERFLDAQLAPGWREKLPGAQSFDAESPEKI